MPQFNSVLCPISCMMLFLRRVCHVLRHIPYIPYILCDMYNHIMNVCVDTTYKLFSALQVSKVLGVTAEILLSLRLSYILQTKSPTMCTNPLQPAPWSIYKAFFKRTILDQRLFLTSPFHSFRLGDLVSRWLCHSLISSAQLLGLLSLSFLSAKRGLSGFPFLWHRTHFLALKFLSCVCWFSQQCL